jgi:hypothetical protein
VPVPARAKVSIFLWFEKSMVYRRVFEMQEHGSVEDVRCINK